MDEGKKGTQNSHLTCDVCKIGFNSNADFALHEFSKKHCDNLIRLAKQKPVVSKQKAKSEIPQVEKQPPKVTSVTHTGSFAKYGYFVPGEIYVHSEVSREFNTDYDPYLQKFAENPYKEKPSLQPQSEAQTLSPIMSFSKKKKKKIKICQVCNITLLTLPEYEAHMKSPQHIWKLKVTGMGVSAHFVKASTDLHTTDINEEPNKPDDKEEEEEETIAPAMSQDNSSSGPFPLLYCSDCELLLNSPQQYNAHINGKQHIECAQKKAELKAKKEKLENPMPNQLYCYSCKISLNNLFQYNEHKNGKKHKTRCRTLIRKGITIPLEERVPGIPHPNPHKPAVYPELYEKLVLEKQKQKEFEPRNPSDGMNTVNENLISVSELPSSKTSGSFGVNNHAESETDFREGSGCYKDGKKSVELTFGNQEGNNATDETVLLKPEAESNSVFGKSKAVSCDSTSLPQAQISCYDKPMPETTLEESTPNAASDEIPLNPDLKEPKTQVSIVTDNGPVSCSVCKESFYWQSQLDTHLGTEDHLKKILELKLSGKSESDILKIIISDRNVVKPNSSGEFNCSICNVTTHNAVEFDQHLNSIVHKYTEKDYRMKRALEVKHMVQCNEKGEYFCKLCQEGCLSLVDYIQHLHFVKHRSIQRAQRAKMVLAKRRTFYLQKQRLMQSVKKRNLSLRRLKSDKNTGVRTKVCGVATDLHTGNQASIPSLEPLEPKIDVTRNVSIGVSDAELAKTESNSKTERSEELKKRSPMQRSSRRAQGVGKQQSRGRYGPSGGVIPPLMPRPSPYPRFSSPGFIPPNRNWAPFSSPRPPAFGPFCGMPSSMGGPYFRPQRYLRPPWPRHRPPFPRF